MYQKLNLTSRKKKILLSLLPAAGLLAFAAGAYAIEPIADGAELFVLGTASVQHNTNVFLLSNGGGSDTIYNFAPGLELDFGKNAQLNGSLSLIETWEIFSTNNGLNTHLADLTFNSGYDDGKTTMNFTAGFIQANQPTATVRGTGAQSGELVNRDTTSVGANGEEQMTDKTSLGAGVDFSYVEYKTPGYSDLQSTTVPVDYYYKYDPKLDFSGGFMYRTNHVGNNGLDSRDYFVDVGARGEFSPLLTGQIRVGFEEEHSGTNVGNNNTVGIQSNFNYAYTPKSNLTLAINNDYGYNAYGAGFRDFGVHIGGNTTPIDMWTFNADLGYDRYAYTSTTQLDNYVSAMVGATFAINTNVSVNGAVTWENDNSSVTNGSFTNTIFSLSVTARY